ncbi:hypothetical protein [Komagataeibacter xylinus]|uniref:hypothetical protein n=1 Tax=Komagataeibacter xylinus TaxID=28448 RepID=UPI0012E94C87|nr:hypothetical protein [Komagataeibacter xylinus]
MKNADFLKKGGTQKFLSFFINGLFSSSVSGSGAVMLALGGCPSHPQIVHDKYTGATACVSGKHTDHSGLLQTLNTIATYVQGKGYAVGIEYNSYKLPVACRLSPVACRLSPVACRLSPVACNRVERRASIHL